MKTNYNYN